MEEGADGRMSGNDRSIKYSGEIDCDERWWARRKVARGKRRILTVTV